MKTLVRLLILVLAPVVFVASCGGRAAPPATSATPSRAPYVPADVAFMQGMIAHHAQALEMTDLVPARTTNRGIRLLAQRIEVSQESEIARMQRWLKGHGEAVPEVQAHGSHGGGEHHAMMPGMLTPEEMDRLASASDGEFDRLFLEFMIRHHQGALTMVADLMSTEGAGQEPLIFRFASDVDTDQRAEIARMQRMLTTLDRGSP